MKLADIMTQLADRLKLIPGLNVYDYPADAITVPAAMVDYPEQYAYDAAYQRGLDDLVVPVYVAVGKASDRSARDNLAGYVDGSGPASVKQILETGQYAAFDTCSVTQVEFLVITDAAVDYLAAKFSVGITGKGAP